MRLRERQRKNVIIGILIVLSVIMTIGYSALSSRLTINGTSSITSDFNVLFTDIQDGTMNNASTIDKSYSGTSATFQVKLDKPGSTAEYNVTVQNQGKLDAYLESIEGIDEANEKAPTYINFKLSGITRYTRLAVNEEITFKVIVTYNSSATEIPNETKQLTLKLNFVQDSGDAPEPSNLTMVEYLLNNQVLTNIDDSPTNGLYAIDNEGNLVNDSNPREYRYIGANPNNYVYFNNELWRIIGIFDNRLKLVRKDSIGSYAWDSNEKNDWTTASLQQSLNSGDYYNKTGYFSENGLLSESKDLIETVTWKLGGVSLEYTKKGTAQYFYEKERYINVYNGRPTEWIGKIGLLYPSDYGFATSGGTSKNRESCLKKVLYEWSELDFENCKLNNWLYDESTYKWFITSANWDSVSSIYLRTDGYIDNRSNSGTMGIYPSLYLKATVQFVSGTGTQEDPYILG